MILILNVSLLPSGVECDLNVNNSVGIRNTHLLRYYASSEYCLSHCEYFGFLLLFLFVLQSNIDFK